jgi:hypothetical protein
LAAIALAFLLNGTLRAGQSASLAWNPVTTTPVAGYAVYMGNGISSTRYDVGTNTQVTFNGLKEGATLYFTVASYNSARMESPASSAISYIVPGLMRLTPPSKPGTPGTLSFPVAVGHSYQLQASTNLTTWTNLWQTPVWQQNAWVPYQDTQAGSFQKRFYRLIMQ